jgi:hemolysin activation/secretion protein
LPVRLAGDSSTGASPHRLAFLLAGAAAVLPVAAAAQAPRPPTREEVERPQLPTNAQQAPRLTVEGGVERAPCALAGEEYKAIRFTPTGAEFEDLRGLSAAALRPAWEPYVGKEQPISVVCEIRDRAATILREAGYIAAVEVPEQRIEGGRLRFQVLMAKLVAIHVRGDAGRSERTIAGYLEKLTQQDVFNRFDAERYLLLASDIPGFEVRLALRSAGAARGEVVGEVTVLRTPAEVDVTAQNFGSHALGRWGGLARAQAYGLTGLGDRTSIALFSTADTHEQQTLQIGHDLRLGSEGLTLSGQFTYAWARPDLEDANINVKARTLLATAEARYPFVRTQAASLWGAAGLDVINQRVGINGLPLTRDRLRVAFARIDFTQSDAASFGRRPGFTAAEPKWRIGGTIELRRGLGILGASQGCGPAFVRCIGPGIVPPSLLEGDATSTVLRAEMLGEIRPMPLLTLAVGVRGQYSPTALLSFEQYAAGNYTVGRGYDPGALLGDRGIGVQTELRYGSAIPAAPHRFALQPFTFFDMAWVGNADRTSPVAGRHTLSSIGLGLRASFAEQARLEAVVAAPLERAGLQTERGKPRFLLSFTTRLVPWKLR